MEKSNDITQGHGQKIKKIMVMVMEKLMNFLLFLEPFVFLLKNSNYSTEKFKNKGL
jgi:hypothetical protein